MINATEADESRTRGMAEKLTQQLEYMLHEELPGCERVEVSSHTHVYSAGQRDCNLYLIESGCVKLLQPLGELQLLVAIYGPGDLFGESCLCGRTTRQDSAVAVEDTRILKVSSEAFQAVVGQNLIAMSLAQSLAARVSERQDFLASLLADNLGAEQ
jgi:CRP-like cAMP-binding protein